MKSGHMKVKIQFKNLHTWRYFDMYNCTLLQLYCKLQIKMFLINFMWTQGFYLWRQTLRRIKGHHLLYENTSLLYRCPKVKHAPSCCWQNCCFSPSKSGFKDQHLVGSDGVRSGSHVYWVTDFKDGLTQPVMRAKDPMIGLHCHSATVTAAKG